ncbi:F0F1 ATP synthase subunit gamma [Actinomadura parmotrematis]|uniref:ATP synthase gamma chain n=1 Tax=Actinomadura parmotrematis TaxID=2864039 RepID=A0ABS7FSK4_9ACTN|nr:F0F1 ATP synthase subunit gamma [Actinomadura parmotrematis]MBW8483281.1 F0F1 ATP synthase subunit gamma [Actinomadura parmotrematis]
MAAQLRALRSRIRSVKSTAKITRAQELVATANISTAQNRLAAAKPYADQVTAAVSALVSHHNGIAHPLLDHGRDTGRAAVLMMTSDRGFCGGYNVNVIKATDQLATALREQGGEPVVYAEGQRGIDNYRFREKPTAAEWGGRSGHPTYELAAEIGATLLDAFSRPVEEGGVGAVHIVYTEFHSMLEQRTTVRRILPLAVEDAEADAAGGVLLPAYDFEPTPAAALDGLLRQYVNARIWHMLLESAAAEWAARRTAMMAATDNAHDLVDRLTREANEARQAEITNELSEIVAGADALTAADSD